MSEWTNFLNNFKNSGNIISGWISSFMFWIILIIILCVFGILFLYIRKLRKFDKIVLEHFDEGDGRFNFRITRGGWFKSKFALFGLWDYGSEYCFRLKDMTPVDNISHNDYRQINGKSAICVMRSPHDQKIAVPISRYYLTKNSKDLLVEIAPADYREAAIKAIEQTDEEMTNKWQQYAPVITIGIVIIISLIITLLNTQYGKYMVDKASALILELKNTPCLNIPSTTAP